MQRWLVNLISNLFYIVLKVKSLLMIIKITWFFSERFNLVSRLLSFQHQLFLLYVDTHMKCR